MSESRKSVVIELTTRLLVSLPENWTPDDIDCYYNESNRCISNEFAALARATQGVDSVCGCNCTHVKYLRDAGPGDNVRAIDTRKTP